MTKTTSNSPFTPGFKDCDKKFLMPDIASPDYIDRVFELCIEEKIDVLVSAFDLDIHRLAGHRKRFVEAGITTFIVSDDVSTICFDKMETARFLDAKGIPHPKTFASCADAKSTIADGRLSYPLYVKPRFGFASKNLFVARNELELDAFFNYDTDMIVQEKLSGREYSFDILNDLQGEVLKIVVKQKLLMRSGETDQAVTVSSQELVDFGVTLGNQLGHVGPLDVDLFWDGTTTSVLELNPRFGGGYPISHFAGADFPALMIQIARGQQPAVRLDDYTAGLQMMKEINAFECSEMVNSVIDLRQESCQRNVK